MRAKRVIVERQVGINGLRRAIADYMSSEGCGCCSDYEKHKEHERGIAVLLHVPKYKDGSGYNFAKFRSKK